jgi:hypothetical protein
MSICSDPGCGPALSQPYYSCTRCRLDFDDETFFQRRGQRGLRGIPRRHARVIYRRWRGLDTVCIGCRRRESDQIKGLATTILPPLDESRARVKFINSRVRAMSECTTWGHVTCAVWIFVSCVISFLAGIGLALAAKR